ncbi:MAG: chromate transporter, partial [Clostridia bacterium]|nr:chromate transporter [Clostridia bacterium]
MAEVSLLTLFFTFFKIGLFTFGGGYAMLPFIQQEVMLNHWIDEATFVNFVGISESSPGPFAINIATFIGMEKGGWLGAALATLGVVLPSFLVILIVAQFYLKFKNSRIVSGVMSGLKPAAVGLIAAAITDTLGCIFFPTGVYFFPFIFIEMAGSLFYALCFYRAKISPTRIIVATALINLGVNIILNTPLMMLYYDLVMGKYYAPFDMLRIAKNLVEIPVETVVLMLVFRALIPATKHLGLVTGGGEKLRFTKKNMAALLVLFVVAVVAVFGFSVYSYNHNSLSADYTPAQ